MWELHPCKMDRLWIVVFVRFFTLALCFSHCCFFLGCGSGLHAVLYTLLLVKIWPFSFTLFLWYNTLSFGSGKINQNLSDLFRLPLGPCFSRGGCISGCLDRLSVFKLIVNHSFVCCACLCSCCQSDSQSVRSSIPDSWSALSVLVSCLLWLVVR